MEVGLGGVETACKGSCPAGDGEIGCAECQEFINLYKSQKKGQPPPPPFLTWRLMMWGEVSTMLSMIHCFWVSVC